MMAEKSYTSMADVLRNHTKYMTRLPAMAMGALKLPPRQVELTHVSVNSVRQCPYCTLLHGELARMTGMPEVDNLMKDCKLEKVSERRNDEEKYDVKLTSITHFHSLRSG